MTNRFLLNLTYFISTLIPLSLFLGCSSTENDQIRLEQAFLNPPDSARAHTWYHWIDGNVSEAGITKDLESFRKVGIDGFQLFDLGLGLPHGRTVFNSDAYHQKIAHTIKEADRLGLEVGVNSASGWSSTGGPWIEPEHSMKMLIWSEQKVTAKSKTPIQLDAPELNEKQQKHDFYQDVAVIAFPTPNNTNFRIANWEAKSMTDIKTRADGFAPTIETAPDDAIIKLDEVVILTEKMDESGKLNWLPPSGNWTVLRVGYTTTAAFTRPASKGGIGLELDKLSKEAVNLHWEALLNKIIVDADGSKTFTTILIDSYEVGCQNWTEGFEKTFEKQRGYDLIPRLICVTGRALESAEYSERVLWDLRKTVADEMNENYFKFFAEKCHEEGLKLASEPYGTGSFDAPQVAKLVDLPMTEFWHKDKPWPKRNLWQWTSHVTSSAAHLTGRSIVGAEAYTRMTGDWTVHPYNMKVWGDRAFTLGINRYYFHTSTHQPWNDTIKPGMTMSRFGSNIHRNNTWFYQSSAWLDYIARCQFIMQTGTYQVDALMMYGDERGFNSFIGNKEPLDMEYIDGYKFDLAGIETLDDLSVDPNGDLRVSYQGKLLSNRYKMLYLKRGLYMRTASLRKLAKLVDQGALIIAQKPTRTPGLENYGNEENEFNQLIEKYWDAGLIKQPEAYEASLKSITPDCVIPEKMDYSHHRIDKSDFYFISNQSYDERTAVCTFRIEGKQPELWNPETGKIMDAPNWRLLENGTTQVDLDMSPAGSVFVVFRKATNAKSYSTPTPVYEELLDITSNWKVKFDPSLGSKNVIEFPSLVPWNEHSDEDVKFYSGTATYSTSFDFQKQDAPIFLDLGQVEIIAQVILNGKDLGILWKPPFRMDISNALIAGENTLKIEVTNLWPNRLIGDAQYPDLAVPKGKTYHEFPEWVNSEKGLPPGSQRKTFAAFNHWNADDELLPSGLIGPVTLLKKK